MLCKTKSPFNLVRLVRNSLVRPCPTPCPKALSEALSEDPVIFLKSPLKHPKITYASSRPNTPFGPHSEVLVVPCPSRAQFAYCCGGTLSEAS